MIIKELKALIKLPTNQKNFLNKLSLILIIRLINVLICFLSNVENLRSVISFKFSDFIILMGSGAGCELFALITAWKFSIIFLSCSLLFIFREGFIGPALLPHSSGWLGGEGTRSGPLREAWQAAGAN